MQQRHHPSLKDQEQPLLRRRREKAGLNLPAEITWGLALSGGGVRSATFNFGLLRALARNHVLKRFDYLSTVSGGGYIGAMLGRLYGPRQDARAVEAGLASDGSLLLWWLRNNGRFLTPAGARDLLMAFSSMLRGFMATQLEVGIMLLCFCALVVLPHVLLGLVESTPDALRNLWSAWFIPLPLLLLGAGALCWAYWFSRDQHGKVLRDLLAVGLALFGALLVAVNGLWPDLQRQLELTPGLLAHALLGGALLIAPLGWLLRLPLRKQPPEVARLRLTHWLGWVLLAIAGVLLTGLSEAATWYLVVFLHDTQSFTLVSTGVLGSTGLIVTLLRTLMPALLDTLHNNNLPGPSLERLSHLLGLALLLFLLLAWLTLLQAFLYLGSNLLFPGASQWGTLPLWHWLAVVALLGLYLWISGANLGQLNLASLHYFYRSRLSRTYIAVANHQAPTPRFPVSPLDSASRERIEGIHTLREILPGDDVALDAYAPHLYGGPVHLVNCCINQTLDDRVHSYNADRKGVALAVSALGVEIGTHGPQASAQLAQTTLAQWVTISGAAVSSGMGSRTAAGVAALIFLTGLRLGFWLPNPTREQANHGWRYRLAKYLATRAELLAQFPGLDDANWYLSDGGHFDNSGVYALLKRQVDLIVASDCGADPRYLFEDLENLVRKAKIDYAADIQFVDPTSLARVSNGDGRVRLFGTPESITPGNGQEFLLLARITYADHQQGTLLIVKPRLCDSALVEQSFDLVGYADRNPDFPQQSTGDQFFDEAQWEAYHQLGLALGSVLSRDLLQNLGNWAGLASLVNLTSLGQPEAPAPQARRQRIAQTVKTSLGVGLSASLVVALWQGWEQYRGGVQEKENHYGSALQEIVNDYGKAPQLGEALQVKIGHLETFAQRNGLSDDFDKDLGLLLEPTRKACGPRDSSSACNFVRQLLERDRLHANPVRQYWTGFDAAEAPGEEVAASVAPPAPAPTAPVPAGTTAPPAETPLAANDAGVCLRRNGRPTVLYTQIYSSARLDEARAFLKGLEDFNLRMPGIENVGNTAARRGSPPPLPWPQPTFIYHTPAEAACAAWLAQRFGQGARPLALNGKLQAVPGVIEFWLPDTP